MDNQGFQCLYKPYCVPFQKFRQWWTMSLRYPSITSDYKWRREPPIKFNSIFYNFVHPSAVNFLSHSMKYFLACSPFSVRANIDSFFSKVDWKDEVFGFVTVRHKYEPHPIFFFNGKLITLNIFLIPFRPIAWIISKSFVQFSCRYGLSAVVFLYLFYPCSKLGKSITLIKTPESRY